VRNVAHVNIVCAKLRSLLMLAPDCKFLNNVWGTECCSAR